MRLHCFAAGEVRQNKLIFGGHIKIFFLMALKWLCWSGMLQL